MWYKKKKVLITDDNQVYLMHISILMKKMGFNVDTADSGTEMLKNMLVSQPDLILLDLNMSGIDGIKMLNKLMGDKSTSSIPVVMISSGFTPELKKKCLDIGAKQCMDKPFSLDDMHKALQVCIYSPMGYTRQYLRTLFHSRVLINYDGTEQNCDSETLSENGIYLLMKEPLPKGTEIAVTLPVTGGKNITINGKVIYTNNIDTLESSVGIAIEFNEPDSSKSALLSDTVRDLLRIPTLGSASEFLSS